MVFLILATRGDEEFSKINSAIAPDHKIGHDKELFYKCYKFIYIQ